MRIYLEDKRVISYPKYLMQKILGRNLYSNEVVHHKDGNPLNNEISNLEVKKLVEHSKQHNPPKYKQTTVICIYCNKPFVLSNKQVSRRFGNRNRVKSGPYCSKSCAGHAGK